MAVKFIDFDIFGRSIMDTKLERELKRIRLKVKKEKTKLLMVAASDITKQRVDTQSPMNR